MRERCKEKTHIHIQTRTHVFAILIKLLPFYLIRKKKQESEQTT